MAELGLEHPLAAVPDIEAPGFTATARPMLGVRELCGRTLGAPHAAAGVLPDQPNAVRSHGAWRILWLAPERWLVVGPHQGSPDDPVHLLASAQLRTTDMSHALTAAALAGERTRAVLARGTPLDLRPSSFGPGRCARTWCAGFPILLDHHDRGMDVYVDSSLALAFWNWLKDAAGL